SSWVLAAEEGARGALVLEPVEERRPDSPSSRRVPPVYVRLEQVGKLPVDDDAGVRLADVRRRARRAPMKYAGQTTGRATTMPAARCSAAPAAAGQPSRVVHAIRRVGFRRGGACRGACGGTVPGEPDTAR